MATQSKPNKPRPNVVKKANETRSKGSKVTKSSKMFGPVGGYPGVSKKQARQLVNDQIKPELRSMRNDRKFVNRQAKDAVADTNSLYNRSVGDLNHVFGEAGDYIGALGQQINQGYSDTATKVGAIDTAATSQIQTQTDAVKQAIQSELQRLGIQQTGIDPRLQADSQFTQNVSTQMGANNQANLAASQQSANTVSGLLGGMIAGSKASNLGQAANTRNAAISDVQRTKRDDLSTILESMQEIKKSRPAMIRDMLMKLQAQGFDQWQAIQALNMDRRSLNHSMAMDRAGLAQDAAYAGTGAQAWSAQAGASAPSFGAPAPVGSTVPGTSSNPLSWVNATPPKKGSKSRGGSGSRNNELPGPLAGGYS